MTTSEQLNQLINAHWDETMRQDPLWATMTGDHRFNDQLPDADEASAQKRLVTLRKYLEQANTFPRDGLSPAEKLNLDIFIRTLKNEMGMIEFKNYRMPVAKVGGFHTFFPDLYQLVPLETEKDYENYITRLRGMKKYFDQVIETMQAGLDDGQIMPKAALENVDEAIKQVITEDAKGSVFFKPFEQFPAGVSEAAQKKLTIDGEAAINESVLPAYKNFLEFFDKDYLPNGRESIAAGDLPNGKEFYRQCIRYYTSLDLTAEQIHETGQSEVKRIKAEMMELIKKVNFDGDFKAFIEFLRTDKRFYVDTPEALMKETAYVLKRIDGELPRMFNMMPRLSYGIREIPAYAAPGSTTAYYMPGAGDGTRAGFYYVNTYDLPSRPLYEIEALSLHEAVPGHHLQLALQQELELPNFRRFSGFTSYVEGWALYSERLGIELGFYSDPYSDFGRLSYEMWRACRLVVDTGMHALGWTRQQAIDFMMDNTSSTLLNVTNEVDRYIAWPGQALAYKIGELKIRELRAKAEKELGDKFDIRKFHDVLLTSGSVPLDVLENMVNEWIQSM